MISWRVSAGSSGIAEELQRLGAVIKGLQGHNEDRAVLKDENAMSLP